MTEILRGVTEYKIINPEKQAKKKKYTDSGTFKFNVKPIQTYSFLQYLQCKWDASRRYNTIT